MNSINSEPQESNSFYIRPILIRKDNGDDKNVKNQPKRRVTFSPFVEYVPDYQDMKMDVRYYEFINTFLKCSSYYLI